MIPISKKKLTDLLEKAKSKRIAVIGDVMMDKYVWGTVSRISPEAPVPVVEIDKESMRLGGAANVANNISSLGGHALLLGVVGDDLNGDEFRKTLKDEGTPEEGIVTDASRPTTVKMRVIAHDQHVVRIDSETKRNISDDVQKQLYTILKKNIDSIDGIIIQDYNKGVIVKEFIHSLVELAGQSGKIITVDPKFSNFFEYRGVTVFKPNKKETEEAFGTKLTTEQDIERAGKLLLEKLHARSILMTRSERGMTLFNADGNTVHIPTMARHVADVSGAGDTVIATLTMMLACGADITEASSIANYAGGIVCGEVGIVPIDRSALLNAIL